MWSNRRFRMMWLALFLAPMVLPGGMVLAQSLPEEVVPTAQVLFPNLTTTQAKRVPPTFTFGIAGTDPDGASGRPARYRYLLIPAVRPDGVTIQVPSQYYGWEDEMVTWDDPGWSSWADYPADPSVPEIQFSDLEIGTYWLLAVQVLDADGTVSIGRGYNVEVMNFYVAPATGPAIELVEYLLGDVRNQGHFQIAASQPLNYMWRASADSYGGMVVSYRYGWDLLDPDDPEDPGWAVPPGTAPENLYSATRSFPGGLHTFYLQVADQSVVVTWTVTHEVVPFVDRQNQLPLLLIDQIKDANVWNWIDPYGYPRNHEFYRNAFWQFLERGPGGVAGFNWDYDRFDHRQVPRYADIVGYKAVLCYAQYYETQTMFSQFRSEDGVDLEGYPVKKDKFVWLTPYQQRGGNLFLVGDRSMMSFIENEPNYMTPMVFDTVEPPYQGGNTSFTVSFGEKTLPDGTVVARGPLLYPYASAGIALLDWTSSNTKYVYGRPQNTARYQRRVDCVGVKGLVLDPDFKDRYGIGPGDFPDTFLTDPEIDWHDDALYAQGRLSIVTNSFLWREDEFVDGNISPRTTAWAPQDCDDPGAPEGMCIEPMFRGMARFDWLREFWWSHGDPDWPTGGDPDYWDYGAQALADSCGVMALTSYEQDGGFVMPAGSALTNGQVFGYQSYVNVANKPGGQPDVFWGFDPYRFDNEQSKQAIRWVLDRFGLLIIE